MTKMIWRQDKAETSLDTYLSKYEPSKTFSPPGGDGWIWVRSNRARQVEEGGSEESIKEARKVLDGVVERYKEIDENPKIPKIKSKTSGPSKKTLRENTAKETEQALRSIGKEWPCGKWLFFERASYVDVVFSKLAHSIIDGPLSKLPNAICHTIKVATADAKSDSSSSSSRGKEPMWLICLYFDVVWNVEHAKEVLECVVKEHGELPNSVKADLYTIIGLDSHHPSKLRSTLYRPAEIFNDEVLKEWQAEYRSGMKRKAEVGKGNKQNNGSSPNKKGALANGQSIPIKPEEYWSASKDDEEDGFEEQETKASPTTSSKTASKVDEPAKTEEVNKHETVDLDDSGSNTEEEEEELITLTAAAPRPKSSSSSPLKDNDTAKKEKDSSPIKQTILATTAAVTSKKRDRFGRSDF